MKPQELTALTKRLVDMMSSVPLPQVKPTKLLVSQGAKTGDEEELVLLLSDLQVGIRSATYNFNTFRKRMENLAKNLLKVTKLHRLSHPVKTLNIFMLGDIVHNENILRFLNLDEFEGVVREQVYEVAIPELTKFLQLMLANFKRVNVWTVRGNHGSFGRIHATTTNLDDFVYLFLREVFRKEPRIRFNITTRFYNLAKIRGWKFLLVHGDTIRMHYQLPFYGITTRAMRWLGSLGDFDYLCLGHFHTYAVLDWNNIVVFMNGTFLSDDDWTKQWLGLKSSICQMLLGVHSGVGVSFIRKILLDKG